jgi:DNA mismatch repair protein MutS
MPFHSILYETDLPPQVPDQVPAPDFFANLNLDQVVGAITARRDEYNLQPFFHTPPPDLETVHYRHEVIQDLEQDAVIDFVKAFSAKMRSMREQIARLNKLHYRYQKEAVFLTRSRSIATRSRSSPRISGRRISNRVGLIVSDVTSRITSNRALF